MQHVSSPTHQHALSALMHAQPYRPGLVEELDNNGEEVDHPRAPQERPELVATLWRCQDVCGKQHRQGEVNQVRYCCHDVKLSACIARQNAVRKALKDRLEQEKCESRGSKSNRRINPMQYAPIQARVA